MATRWGTVALGALMTLAILAGVAIVVGGGAPAIAILAVLVVAVPMFMVVPLAVPLFCFAAATGVSLRRARQPMTSSTRAPSLL